MGRAQPAGTYGPVGQETLWSVAKKVNPQTGGTVAQTAWALYRVNPEAFEGSPTRIKSGATLKIPDAAFVKTVSSKEALASLNGQVAAASRQKAPATAATPGPAPVIAGIELAPLTSGEPYQWLAVAGTGFAEGATLILRPVSGKAPPPRKPQSIRPTRIEYAAKFPENTARWQVAVRNPDGATSAPFEFDGGAHVTLSLAPPAVAAPAPVPVAAPAAPMVTAFAGSPEQAEAMRRLSAGEGADALYQYLAPLEERFAGDVDYDYRLGTSAFDSGRFGEAIFVLQRAVATKPGFAGARMELARAYYAQGDNESARREFTTLQAENPPPEAQRAIAGYLSAIDRRAVLYESQYGAYVDLATGYDTNANGATDTQTFLGFTLDSRNQATSTPYYALAGGGDVSYPLGPDWRVLGNGLATYRSNPDASFVDAQLLQLNGGVEWRPDRFTITALPGYGYFMLDGDENHQALSFDGAAAYDFTGARVSLNLRYAQQRYVEALEIQDIDTSLYGLSTQTNLVLGWPMQLGAAYTLGTDEPTQQGSPFARDLTGGRVWLAADFGGGNTLMLSLATLASDFDGQFFGQTRSDDQVNALLGYEWGGLRASGWSVQAHVAYIDNGSTVQLYEYERVDAGVSVRKEFR